MSRRRRAETGIAQALGALAALCLSSLAAAAACTGTTDLTCTGTVNGGAGNGVTAASTTSGVSVTIPSGSVTGGLNGVAASTANYDPVHVSATGTVTGGSGAGIASTTDIGFSQIDIDAASTVSGRTGVSITTNGAYAILNNNGTLMGTGGAGLAAALGAGSLSANNNGTLTGAGGAPAVAITSGTVSFNNNAAGVVDGAILGKATTTLNNFGAWKNAAGSSVGTLISTGTLALGSVGAFGTVSVAGDATFGASSTTTLRIGPGGASDTIVVGGATTLAGGTLLLRSAPGAYTAGARYTLLSSTGAITGSFASITTDVPKFLPILASDGANLTVSLAQYDFRDVAYTRNQLAAANMVAQAGTTAQTAPGLAVILDLAGIGDDGLRAGFAQIAGDGLTAAKSLALRQGSMFMDAVAEQQAFWRSRDAVDPNGITVRPVGPVAAPVGGPDWYTGRPRPAPVRAVPVAAEDRTIRMWVSGLGGTETTRGNGSDGSAAHTGHFGDGVVGVDAQLGRNVLLGVAGGYSVGAFNVADRATSGTTQGFHVALYTGFTANGFYGSANAGYASYGLSTKRTVAIAGFAPEQETGDNRANELRVRLEAGKLFDLGIGTVTAFTSMQVANLTSGTYVENGASTAGTALLRLAFPSQTTTSAPVSIGFRAETKLRMGSATLAPWVQVALVHDFSTSRSDLEMLAVLPGVAQRVFGAPDARDTLRLKGGLQLVVTPRAALFVSAQADLSSQSRAFAGQGGFRYGW